MAKTTRAKRSKAEAKGPFKRFIRVVRERGFGRIYAAAAVAILLITSAIWALLSARVQWGNADQTVNALLFDHGSTFRGALFPGQHSSLIKWPLFLVIKMFGYSSATFTSFTVIISLATVGLLAYILQRIERRPLVFGTLCLALASVLLLVPAQPYAGGLLPINMAMLTTRNLEYIIYIGGLALLIRSSGWRSRSFWLGVVCLGLLIASDKLFLTLTIGGALLALVAYATSKTWNMVTLSVSWLLGGLAAGAGAIALLWFVQAARITHIVSQSTAGPYAFTHSMREWALGSIYAVLGLATNFGANPGFDATIIKNTPHNAFERLAGPSSVSYLINLAILVISLVATWRILHPSFARSRNKKLRLDEASKLSIVLIWSSLVATLAFIATSHYYAVDARYLAIVVFTVFIASATFTRQKTWQPHKLVIAGLVMGLGIVLSFFSLGQTYHQEKAALSSVNERNALVALVLKHHPVNVLVGDYWRVIPTKLTAKTNINILPLASCNEARGSLSSRAWQPDLNTHSFAYLLTLSGNLTDYHSCSLSQVLAYYGRPNASTLIAGSLDKPKELLLFYDHGINNGFLQMQMPLDGPATVIPIPLDQLPATSCPVPTIMNIVAHEDDDLLFINPDTLHSIKAGNCVRTIYMTAGDAGTSALYWLGRERGSQLAYSQMTGSDTIWVQRIVKLANKQFITVANPRGNTKISLIFMHLPDGNVRGQGFRASRDESLAALEGGKIASMHTVDGQSSYTSQQLVDNLEALMHTYQPTEIRTQNPTNASEIYPDHSDHMAVGRYVQRAYLEYEKQQYENSVTIPIHYYLGYPIHQMPENVSGADLVFKEAAWYAYARYDSSVCQSPAQCSINPAYGAYLPRQYQAH